MRSGRLALMLYLAIAAAPALAEAELDRARGLLASGEYKGAEIILRLLPAVPQSRRLLTKLLIETGRTAEAGEVASRFLDANPNLPEAVAIKAETAFFEHRLSEAEELFVRALALDTENRRARVFLKRIYDLTGRPQESERIVDYFWDYNNRRLVSDPSPDPADFVYVAEAVNGHDSEAMKVAFRHFRRAYRADSMLDEAYIGAGDLAVEVFDWSRAESEFKALLERNPSHPMAHLGLARLYLIAARNAEAEASARKALETNPFLDGARVVLASLHTIDDRLEEARIEVDAAKAASPRDPEAMAIDAAWLLVSGDRHGFDRTVAALGQMYPGYADVHLMTAEILERRRRFPEAMEQYKRAREIDPRGWHGWYGVGMTLVRMGEERAGYEALEVAFERNPFNQWAYNTLVVLDSDFKDGLLARRDTDNFTIKVSRTLDAVFGEQLEDTLELIWKEETARFGFKPGGPEEFGGRVLFEMFADHDDFSARTAGMPNLGALGAALGQVVTMPSPGWGISRGNAFRWTEVIRHEFAHVITLQMTDYRISRWFTEGISVYVERDPQAAWDWLLARSLNEGQIPTLDRLNSLFTRPEDPRDVALGYYQAGLVVGLIVERHGFDAIKEACRLVREGVPHPEAMSRVTGLSPEALDRAIEEHIRAHAMSVRAWAPPGPKEAARLQASLELNPSDWQARARLAEGLIDAGQHQAARREAERAVRDSAGRSARGYAVLGALTPDPAESVRLLKKAVTADPEDHLARVHLGLALARQGLVAQAADSLERAHELNPRFFQPIAPWGTIRLSEKAREFLVEAAQPGRAAAVAERAARTDATDWRSSLYAGRHAMEGGRFELAAEMLALAVEVNPFDAETQLLHGRALEKLRVNPRAARAYRSAMALDERNAEAHLGLARVYAAMGRTPEALAALDLLETFDPMNAEARALRRSMR